MIANFSNQVDIIAKEVNGKIKEVIADIREATADMIINTTPIDTGLARGNWQSSIGKPKTKVIERYDRVAGYAPTLGSGLSLDEAEKVSKKSIKKDFYLINNVDYINDLEFSFTSKQAPRGMVRQAVVEFPGIVELSIRKVANL